MINRTLAELDREWVELQAAPASVRALARWSSVEPALDGCHTLGDILRTHKARPSMAPAILAALARLSLDDELAARTLLQALVPGLLSLVTGPLAGSGLGMAIALENTHVLGGDLEAESSPGHGSSSGFGSPAPNRYIYGDSGVTRVVETGS